MHALAHPLGAIYDAHHGMLNAILMPYVLTANRDAIGPQIERLARYLKLSPDFDSFLQWIIDLRAAIGIHENLGAIGIDEKRVANPIQHSAEAYTQIVSNAIQGNLS